MLNNPIIGGKKLPTLELIAYNAIATPSDNGTMTFQLPTAVTSFEKVMSCQVTPVGSPPLISSKSDSIRYVYSSYGYRINLDPIVLGGSARWGSKSSVLTLYESGSATVNVSDSSGLQYNPNKVRLGVLEATINGSTLTIHVCEDSASGGYRLVSTSQKWQLLLLHFS